MAQHRGEVDRLRKNLSPVLQQVLGSGGGEYEPSFAFAEHELRRLLGGWTVTQHEIGGQSYLDLFRARQAPTLMPDSATYTAVYIFKRQLCLKRVRIEGFLERDGTGLDFLYTMAVALSWEVGAPGQLRAVPEIGYQSSRIGGAPAGVSELSLAAAAQISIAYRFEGDDLIFQEGEDSKRLRRDA